MTDKWHKTTFPGVRYREHATRKHGIQKDRYFTIRYQLAGKRTEEKLGWASEGWTAQKAAIELAKLKQAHITGEGPITLKEKRKLANKRRQAEKEEEEREVRESITFGDYFRDAYYPNSQAHRKQTSYKKDEQHFVKWLNPALGNMALKRIKPFHLERVKKNLIDAKKSPRTIDYVMGTFRQVWNMAMRDGIVSGDSPTKRVKVKKTDNRRTRFLSFKEASQLLENLRNRNTQVHDMALLSLQTGMRASEIFNLCWGDVDLDRGLINIRDPKGIKGRAAFMTDKIRDLFAGMKRKAHSEYVFTDKTGKTEKKFNQIPYTFKTSVKSLGLNEGITDPRERVVFHTLRHTYASWLVESGVSLYMVKELLGHSTLAMTERYSHLGENTLVEAVRRLDERLEQSQAEDREGSSVKK